MIRPRSWSIFLLVFGLAVAGCGCSTSVLPVLGRVTLIKVTKNGKEVRANISDTHSIGKITEFVNDRREGWEKPWRGTPVPAINVEFYDGEDHKADFGIGKGFFESQRRDEFWSKTATPDEVVRSVDLLGISGEYLNQ